MMRKIFVLLSVILFVGIVSAVSASNVSTLEDVKGHWAEEHITEMVNKGYINGYPDDTFRPNASITRAEFVSILSRLLNLENDGNTFKDKDQAKWANKYIGGAIEAGIIDTKEYNNEFSPNTSITRREMAKMISLALAHKNNEYAQVLEQLKGLYYGDIPVIDAKEIKDADLPYIALAFGTGILTGYEDDSFRPVKNATRAEATVILKRFMSIYSKSPDDFQYVRELVEVALTGTNATTVSELIVLNTPKSQNMVIDMPNLTATLKRVYVLPTESDVVSFYEKKFLGNRDDELLQLTWHNMKAAGSIGLVVGVADVEYKRDLDVNYALALDKQGINPGMIYLYQEPRKKYGFYIASMRDVYVAKKGQIDEVAFFGEYGSDNSRLYGISFRDEGAIESNYYPLLEMPR